MLQHRSPGCVAMLLLLAIFATWLPGAAPVPWSQTTSPLGSAAHAATPSDPPQDVTLPALVTPAADTTPSRPVLSLALDTADDTVALGDTTTISITVSNRGVVPAPGVSLTLPIPAGVTIVTNGGGTPGQATLTWDLGTLDAQGSTTRVLTVRANSAVTGDPILFQPQASAPSAVANATVTSGFVIVQRGLGAAVAAFTPGAAASLVSQDGRVRVQVPPGLFGRALTLRQRSLLDARDDLVQQSRPLPPRFVGAHRALPPFVLDATDAAGADVHQFDAPLTVSVIYTPEQLQALGIREGDLQLYWFDETARTWQALPTSIDTHAHTASAQMAHFTLLTLSDGSSPSAAYLPSLQNWQVSQFTGAASYRYPIELPGGPGGLAPQLALSYSSAASQGSGGTRPLWQASWLGKGWDLDGIGYVATNENTGSADHTWDSYTMVFGGQSLDLVKGKRVDGAVSAAAYADYALDHWNWYASDENFTRVSAVPGGGVYGWRAWTKDGTRYEFDQALRWGENQNNTYWTYKWLLTKIVDTHGNAIAFDYVVDPIQNVQTIHPTYYLQAIRWAFDGATPGTGTARYRVAFTVSDRQTGTTAGVDANWEYSTARVSGQSGTPHQKYRLDDITVQSWPSGAAGYQTIRSYHLSYASAASSVQTDVSYGQKVLTLLNIEQRDQNNQTVVSAGAPSPEPFKTTFTYGMTQGNALMPNADWNKIDTIDNGRGGRLTFTYGRVWALGATPNNNDSYTAYYQNYYRVTQVLAEDLSGTGKQALTVYDYGAASNAVVNDEAHAATVLYAKYPPSGQGDSTQYLTHTQRKEFRGHATVIERVYDGGTTGSPLLRERQSWFYQGNSSSTGDPSATCSPVSGSTLDTSSSCYTWMKQFEGLRGRAYKEETRGGATVLSRTQHTFGRYDLPFFGSDTSDAQFSNYYQRAGVWRAFNPETKTEQQTIGSSTLTKTTLTYFNDDCNTATLDQYGNVGCILEQEVTSTVRKTLRYYLATNTASSYIVDRMWGEAIYDTTNKLVALTHRFFDNTSNAQSAPTEGELRLTRAYYDLPYMLNCCGSATLHGQDSGYGYDAYGNQTSVSTYAAAGTWSSANGYSGPGAGSAARTTTTAYDTTFHSFPTQVTHPTVNGVTQTETGGYDYRMGTLTSVTDANNATTSAYYDTFGRMVALVKPGDSTTWPTVQAYYYDTERPFRYRVRQLGLTGQEDYRESQQFYDGLGRKIQTKAESSDGSANLINVVSDTRYDGLSRVVAQSQPRYVTESGASFFQYTTPGSLYNPTTTSYDALGRPLSISAPGSRTTTHTYGVELVSSVPRSYDEVSDPLSHRTRSRFDAFGRRTQVIEYATTNATTS